MASFNYNTLLFRQRPSAKVAFCLLAAPVGEILAWARVDRMEPDNRSGVQRKKNDSKTASISRFFQVDGNNTIPTAMTIALPWASTEMTEADVLTAPTDPHRRELVIRTDEGMPLPGLIIDGQHRIFGINSFDPTTPINVVLMLGADDAEIAFQFLVINNKVSKVSPDHIKALKLAYREDQLDSRLTKAARMKSTGAPTYLETIDSEPDSPFRGRLNWPLNPETEAFKLIPPPAFELALLHISNQEVAVGGDQDVKNFDLVVDFFLAVWKEVQAAWPEAWTDSRSRLLSKLGVTCMSQYLVDSVIARVEASDDLDEAKDLEKVRSHVHTILERQEYQYWQVPWTATSLDTNSGRELVVKDLRKIAINKRSGQSWEKGLKLVDSLE